MAESLYLKELQPFTFKLQQTAQRCEARSNLELRTTNYLMAFCQLALVTESEKLQGVIVNFEIVRCL